MGTVFILEFVFLYLFSFFDKKIKYQNLFLSLLFLNSFLFFLLSFSEQIDFHLTTRLANFILDSQNNFFDKKMSFVFNPIYFITISLVYLLTALSFVLDKEKKRDILRLSKICFFLKIIFVSQSVFVFFVSLELLRYYFFIYLKESFLKHKQIINFFYFSTLVLSTYLLISILGQSGFVNHDSFDLNFKNLMFDQIKISSNKVLFLSGAYLVFAFGLFPFGDVVEKFFSKGVDVFVAFFITTFFPAIKLVFELDLFLLKKTGPLFVGILFYLISLVVINLFSVLRSKKITQLILKIFNIYMVFLLIAIFYINDDRMLQQIIFSFVSSLFLALLLSSRVELVVRFDENKKKIITYLFSFSLISYVGFPGFYNYYSLIDLMKKILNQDYLVTVFLVFAYVLMFSASCLFITSFLSQIYKGGTVIKLNTKEILVVVLLIVFNFLILF